MEPYTLASAAASKVVMRSFSTSFGLASRLFSPSIRQDIYNIYGLVRIADEIVDSYRGADAASILDELELDTYRSIESGFSSNPIVHSYATTAKKYNIPRAYIHPFFVSMHMDISTEPFDEERYSRYIYGSAEVVGLMCLSVFTSGSVSQLQQLTSGARALGAGFQKVNFLRDLAEDHNLVGRYYFPIGSFESFDEPTKRAIIADIRSDFEHAKPAIADLPPPARPAVSTAFRYYSLLLEKLAQTPASVLKQKRIRLPTTRKLLVFSAGAPASLKARRAA
jgi:phytoene synthase